MADNPFGEIGGQLLDTAGNSIVWLGIGLIIIILVGGLMWYFAHYRKKFDIKVLIKSERANEGIRLIEDKAAILYDKKDKSYYLRLLETKLDIPAPPYDIIQRTNKGDYIELYRGGEDEISYLLPGTINKRVIVRQDGTEFPVEKQESKRLDGDIAYWNIKRKEKNKALFDAESILMKILPYIPILVGGVMVIFIIYIVFDSLPSLIDQLTKLASQLESLKGAEVTTYG